MREILYRGFHECENGTRQIQIYGNVIKGRWIEGFYIDGYICSNLAVDDDENFMPEYWWDVIPETVCQYTGLKDKKGRKVFEWDIIRYPGGAEYEVFFDDEFAAFRANNGTDIHFINGEEIMEVEIIGTKFDVEVESESKRV